MPSDLVWLRNLDIRYALDRSTETILTLCALVVTGPSYKDRGGPHQRSYIDVIETSQRLEVTCQWEAGRCTAKAAKARHS